MRLALEGMRPLLEQLPPELKAHCQRVREEALKLASLYGCSFSQAEVAALGHDIARALDGARLLYLAREFSLPVLPEEEQAPVLLHGPVGAQILHREGGIGDTAILEAVACHTTGKVGMSLLDKVLFLGDKLEPGKADMLPGLEKVRILAREDLDRALAEFLRLHIKALRARGLAVHPATLEALEELKR